MRVAQRATSASWRLTVAVGKLAPWPLAALALALFVAQPVPDPIDHDALIGVAGILATVLTIGFAVTLLVAQHTSERHARVLYAEFRREHAWLSVLGFLAIGVVLIVAGALIRSTVSTGWASLALAVALGIYTATLVPHLLDSLDGTKLADQATDRVVKELNGFARSRERNEREDGLKPVAERGLEIGRLIAVQGALSNDTEVLRSGFRGMRRVLVAYIEGSPTRGWDGEIVNLGFQSFRDVVTRCLDLDPVLMMRVVLEELTAFGVESQRTLEADGAETVSGRLNTLFFEVVRGTLMNDQSAAAAMATRGIGDSALALLRAHSPNMVTDHIGKLRAVALGSMQNEKDHVAGEAHVQLVKIAIGLASLDSRDIMPPSLFQEACAALCDTVDAFVERASTSGGLANDWAWNQVTMAWARYNVSRAVIAGIAADARMGDERTSRFGHGANALVHALVKLGTEGTGGFSTSGHAVESAYTAVLGSMALNVDQSPKLIPEMYEAVIGRLVDPDKEKMHEIEMLAGLVLAGVYEAESPRATAPGMRQAVLVALDRTKTIADDFHRKRRARAWIGGGRAALGSGDEPLADAIAAAIAPDVQEVRSMADGRPWMERDGFFNELFTREQAIRLPDLPDHHTKPEVVAAFDVLLGKHRGPEPPKRAGLPPKPDAPRPRRPRRRTPKVPPPP